MSLIKSFDPKEEHFFQLMVSLHLYTKKYLLIAEEIAENGEIFIQPLKEQRDAFDHLIRCYGAAFEGSGNITEQERERYIKANLDKACGHVYRAFFDTADWLTYMLRKWIREKLQQVGETNCEKRLSNYGEIKDAINNIPLQVAALRESKDIAKMDGDTKRSKAIQEVSEYIAILDRLIAIRSDVIQAFGPVIKNQPEEKEQAT